MNVRQRESWMWAEACALLDEAERRHRQFFQLLAAPARTPVWEPPADVFSDGGEVQVIVALPGARAEGVQVQIGATGLQIDAHVAAPPLSATMKVVRMEVPYGQMRRCVELPPGRYALLENRLEGGCLFLRLRRSMP